MGHAPWHRAFVMLSLLTMLTMPAGAATSASTPAPTPPSTGTTPPATDRLGPPMMPGWPQQMGVGAYGAPTGVLLADVDNDGYSEVLAGSPDYRFRVWNYQGQLLYHWPVGVGQMIESKAAAADVDGDGDLEIAFASVGGKLHLYHHTAWRVTGWPKTLNIGFGYISPTFYDLDGNGRPEILMPAGAFVHAWYGDGTPVPGFPCATGGSEVTGTLAVGDIDNDSSPEILASTGNGSLYAFHADGNVVAGWPQVFGWRTSYGSPSIGDADNDGRPEIFVVGYDYTRTSMYAYRGDGTMLPGFPVVIPAEMSYSTPVLGDADGDGDLEIFNASVRPYDVHSVYAWDHTGAVLPGWPVAAHQHMVCSPIVVDFDDAAGMEVATADQVAGGYLYGFHLDGTVAAPDFPVTQSGGSTVNSAEVGDVDRDGDLDLALTTTDGMVALYDFSTPWSESRVEWGGWFHDNWNTNQYGFRPFATASADEHGGGVQLLLGAAWPNPFGTSTSIHFLAERGGWTSLEVYDPSGRLVRVLHQGALPAGGHTVTWDGAAANDQPAPAGVYFLRLRDAEGVRGRGAVNLVR